MPRGDAMSQLGFRVKRRDQFPGIPPGQVAPTAWRQTRFRAAAVRRPGHGAQSGQAQGVAAPFVTHKWPQPPARAGVLTRSYQTRGILSRRSARCPLPRGRRLCRMISASWTTRQRSASCLLGTPADPSPRGSTRVRLRRRPGTLRPRARLRPAACECLLDGGRNVLLGHGRSARAGVGWAATPRPMAREGASGRRTASTATVLEPPPSTPRIQRLVGAVRSGVR